MPLANCCMQSSAEHCYSLVASKIPNNITLLKSNTFESSCNLHNITFHLSTMELSTFVQDAHTTSRVVKSDT